MNGSEVYRRIIESGIMPTTFVYDVAETVSLSRTLHENGIRVIELLQRTPDALRAVGAVKEAIPGMVVGAGTVRTLEAAKEAAAAGADYIVSPYYSQEIVDWCCGHGVAVIPGCATITEVSCGYQSGLRYFKYFPVKQLGGVEAIRQISEIYSDVRYVVTGGISYDDLLEFAPNPYVMAVGTVCMMPRELVAAHDWNKIAKLTRQTVAGSLGLELMYVDRSRLDAAGRRLAEALSLYSQARGRVPEIPEEVQNLSGNPVAGLYANSLERALAFFRELGLDGRVLVNGENMAPVVADVQVPALGGGLRLVARHHVYKT